MMSHILPYRGESVAAASRNELTDVRRNDSEDGVLITRSEHVRPHPAVVLSTSQLVYNRRKRRRYNRLPKHRSETSRPSHENRTGARHDNHTWSSAAKNTQAISPAETMASRFLGISCASVFHDASGLLSSLVALGRAVVLDSPASVDIVGGMRTGQGPSRHHHFERSRPIKRDRNP